MTSSTGINKSGLMVLKTLIALKGRTQSGLSNGDIAKAINVSPSNATRYLNTLIAAGLATKLETGRFALSVGMVQIAQSVANELLQAHDRISETRQRIDAGSY